MKDIIVHVKKNEETLYPYIWIDDSDEEVTLTATLDENASLTILGLFFGSKHKKALFNTRVIHSSVKSKSLTLIRGVFQDNSSFSNEGLVKIEKGAKGADGYFASKVLLFNDARGKSVPSLEIDENELKAGHASTVGRPDEEQLFYMRSRGLSENDSKKLIISGFFEPVLEKLTTADRKKVMTKLKNYNITFSL